MHDALAGLAACVSFYSLSSPGFYFENTGCISAEFRADNCTKISPSESNSVSLSGVKLILYMKLKSSSINLFITENVSSRYKVTDLFLEDKHFLFQPGTPAISTKYFHFPRSFNESAQLVSKLGHGRFRTCLFRFIIYQLCRHLNSRRTNKSTQTFSKPVFRNNYC
jgi:hypothetical protein